MAVDKDGTEFSLRITGSGDAAQFVEKVNKGLDETATKAAKAGKAADTLFETWQKGLDKVTKALTSAQSALASLNPAFGAALGLGQQLFAVYEQALQRQAEVAQKAALLATLDRDLGQGFAGALRGALGGQVFGDAERTIQRATLAAQQAGLAQTEILGAVEAATKLANERGQDVAQTVSTVLKALTTGEAGEAKALGLVVDTAKAEAEYAQQIGVAASALDQQAKINARNLDLQRQLADAAKGQATEEARRAAEANERFANLQRLKASALNVADTVAGILTADPLESMAREGQREWLTFLQEATAGTEELVRAYEQQQRAETDAERLKRAHVETLEKELIKRRDTKEETIAQTLALASYALGTGRADQAVRLFADAQKAMAQSTKDTTASLSDQLRQMERAEAQAIQTAIGLAALASAQGSPLATKLWEDVQSRLGAKAPPARRGGGGSRQPRPDVVGTAGDVSDAIDRRNRERAEALDRLTEAELRQVQAEDDVIERQIKAREALDMATTAQSAEQLARAFGALGDAGGQALADSLAIGIQAVERFQKVMDLGKAAGLDFNGQLSKAAPGAISAIGQIGAAWADSAAAKYGILSVAELAAGIASSFINPAESGSHYAASAVYATAAGMALAMGGGGGVGGGTAAARRTPAPAGFGAQEQQREDRGTSLVISLEGANLFADDPKVYQKLGLGIRKHLTKWGG